MRCLFTFKCGGWAYVWLIKVQGDVTDISNLFYLSAKPVMGPEGPIMSLVLNRKPKKTYIMRQQRAVCWEIYNIQRISGDRETTDRQTTDRRIQDREEENAETKREERRVDVERSRTLTFNL